MPRVAKASPVSPALYRHFAVVTILVTAAVAILADGDNRAKMADAVQQQTRSEKPTGATVGGMRDARKTSFSSGFGADEGPPSDVYVDSGAGGGSMSLAAPGGMSAPFPNQLPPVLPAGIPGATVTQIEAAPAAKRRHKPTPEELRRLEEQSALRSGAEE